MSGLGFVRSGGGVGAGAGWVPPQAGNDATGAAPSTSTGSVVVGSEFAAFERHNTGFGAKMLAKMGWRAGEGLGAERQGVAVPVEANGNLGNDRTGIGAQEAAAQARAWKRTQKKARFEASKAARKDAQLAKRRAKKAKPAAPVHGCYL
eukprot:CAMPEP_0203833046 /NCGR_PEP_ID=MMETSP0115-20131106/72312_1 /ASSEMBLY_ACC=CAM_ASM_000227 /TAXON_ID=33651 /ORGANISM="Bicosoecid sp, Strain ms1" /LENGTH=148 /DNA_ID=CAMNT_0050742117 /DNA_START=1 /DNA_END=443 /DNA_ORIENTATION=-